MKFSNFFLIVMTLILASSTVFAETPDIQNKANEIGNEKSVSGSQINQDSSTNADSKDNDPDISTDPYIIVGDPENGATSKLVEELIVEELIRKKVTPAFKIKTKAIFDITCGMNTKYFRTWLKVIKATNTAPKLTLSKDNKTATTVDNVTGDAHYGRPPAKVDANPGIYRVEIIKTKPPASEEVEMKVQYGCHKADGTATTVDNFKVIQLQ